MCKKIVSFLLCLMLMMSVLPVGATGLTDKNVTLYGFRIFGDESGNAFVHFDAKEPSQVTVDKDQIEQIGVYAGTYVGGKFYGVDRTATFFTTDFESFERTTIAVVLDDPNNWQVGELTYDYENSRLIMLANNLQTDVRTSALYAIDPDTGNSSKLCEIGNEVSLRAMAADPDGKIYGIDAKGMLYTVDVQTGVPTEIGTTGKAVEGIQSMCFDRESGVLYWANYAGVSSATLCKVDPSTGTTSDIGVIGDNAKIAGLCVASDAFRVKFVSEVGGSAGTTGATYYQVDQRVSLTATPDKGYQFGGWSVTGGTLSHTGEETSTLVMPAQDVTVTAYFVPNAGKYTERTVRDNEAGVMVWGNSLYYNTTVAVSEIEDQALYGQILAKTKDREIVRALDLDLVAHIASGSVAAHKGKLSVSVRVDAAYEGEKLTVWQVLNGKVVSTTATVKDGVLTYKTNEMVPIVITQAAGITVWTVLLILLGIIVVVFIGFVLYILALRRKRLRRAQEIAARKAGKPLPKKRSLRSRLRSILVKK